MLGMADLSVPVAIHGLKRVAPRFQDAEPMAGAGVDILRHASGCPPLSTY